MSRTINIDPLDLFNGMSDAEVLSINNWMLQEAPIVTSFFSKPYVSVDLNRILRIKGIVQFYVDSEASSLDETSGLALISQLEKVAKRLY